MKPFTACFLLLSLAAPLAAQEILTLENHALRAEFQRADATIRLIDKSTGVRWFLGAPQLILKTKQTVAARPSGDVVRQSDSLKYMTPEKASFELRLVSDPAGVEYSYSPGPDVEEVLLLHKSLPLEAGDGNYYAVPQRLGVLLPVEGAKPYSRRLRAYDTGRGYSMAFFGAVKDGSALLATWEDPYTEILVDYTVEPKRLLSMGLSLRRSARSVRLHPIGRGGYVEIAKAYRPIARQRGYLKTLAERMREQPRVEQMFGAADFKPFAFMRLVPNTPWNKTGKTIWEKNFTFDECARLAEHYKNDLGIDRAMLVLNGWIKGGYDNYHPDVLPAAAEIGGDDGLTDCSRRVKSLGWLFGLHDNYQDMYRDAPSWNEDCIMKNADGSLHKGGVWAGGPCWLICSIKSLELAQRPRNIPQVKMLFSPTLYFSDTIFASPPYECHDPRHPLTFADDIRHKQILCDYLRNTFGLFGSEEGREWGVPHADYFEGLMSHRTGFDGPRDTDIIIPLFEIVFGDCIPLYTHQSDRPKPDDPLHILDHILYAEMPVYYFGKHLYWKDPAQEYKPAAGEEGKMVFAQGGQYGAIDQFIKNTYEVLSPLNRATALTPMTGHRFLTPDRKVEQSRFGDVEITVNYGAGDYAAKNALLPQYGFLVEGPTLTAFHARSYRGKKFTVPSLIVVRSTDGKPLESSRNTQLYRGFGAGTVVLGPGRTIEEKPNR